MVLSGGYGVEVGLRAQLPTPDSGMSKTQSQCDEIRTELSQSLGLNFARVPVARTGLEPASQPRNERIRDLRNGR